MLNFPITIVSVLEVVLLLVPALVSVAFVTLAERKTMASMQRRLGPNTVGSKKWKFSFKKFYHNSAACGSTSTVFYKKRRGGYIYDKAIEALYKNRKAPVKPFKGKVVNVCKDLLSSTALNAFFKELKGKGGIYMFTNPFGVPSAACGVRGLKDNPNIFYIGSICGPRQRSTNGTTQARRAKDFQKRFKSHLNIKLNDRFHAFANTIGWDKFEFSVIEICNLDTLQERENYYLQNYLPLLNTIFKSNLNDAQTYDSLYDILKLRQLQSNFENKYQGINIYLYEYVNGHLGTSCNTFSSINKLSNYLGIARETTRQRRVVPSPEGRNFECLFKYICPLHK